MCQARLRLLRPLSALLFFILAMVSAGCVPSLTWLPDSSGFICTGGKDGLRLIHYDLVKGESHVLVEDTGAGTNWPAVSPDGKQIAVAKLVMKPGQKRTALQVVLYSVAGKEQKRSKEFDWLEAKEPAPKDTTPDRQALPQLFWAPKGDKVLVTTSGYTAIYDLKADRLVHAGEGWLLIFGTTPVRPDGTGFLLMKNVGRWIQRDKKEKVVDPGFTFVGWDGAEKPLKSPALLMDAAALNKEEDANKLMGLLCPFVYQSGWNGDVAQVTWNGDRLRYLTDKGEAVLDRIEAEKTTEGLPIVKHYSFPGGRSQVRVIMSRWDEKNPKLMSPSRVEFLKTGQKEPKVLVEKSGGLLIPSPNGKLVALRSFPEDRNKDKAEKEDTVIVVNDQGEVVARVSLGR